MAGSVSTRQKAAKGAPGPTALADIAAACEGNVLALAQLLQRIEVKHCELMQRADDSEVANDRLVRTEHAVQSLKFEFESLRELEQLRRQEVARLEAVLEAERLQARLTSHRLQQQLAEEQLRSERLRVLHEDAMSQREDALAELACSYADLEAMQATLADSAVYVKYLRRKVLELELQTCAMSAQQAAAAAVAASAGQGSAAGAFNLSTINAAICSAVDDAFTCGEEERKKRLKQLLLRWHPDKNPVLTEVATEVSKLINAAVAAAEARTRGGAEA